MEKFFIIVIDKETRKEFDIEKCKPYPVYDVKFKGSLTIFLIANNPQGFQWIPMESCYPFFGFEKDGSILEPKGKK